MHFAFSPRILKPNSQLKTEGNHMTNIISTSAASIAAAAVRAMPMPVLAASDSVRQYCLPTHEHT